MFVIAHRSGLQKFRLVCWLSGDEIESRDGLPGQFDRVLRRIGVGSRTGQPREAVRSSGAM
jgi:hypothetical protein